MVLHFKLSIQMLNTLEDFISYLRDTFHILWKSAKKKWSYLKLDASKESRKLSPLNFYLKAVVQPGLLFGGIVNFEKLSILCLVGIKK
jgi:hypothetical protein